MKIVINQHYEKALVYLCCILDELQSLIKYTK